MGYKKRKAILKDGGEIVLKRGNFDKYGVFSNRMRIDSKEFSNLKKANAYFDRMKKK